MVTFQSLKHYWTKTQLVFLLLFGVYSSYSQSAEFVRKVSFAKDRAVKLTSVVMDSGGRLYVLNSLTGSILVAEPDGRISATIDKIATDQGDVALKSPACMFIDQSDNLYIYDVMLGKVLVRYALGGGRAFGEKGSQPGQMGDITALAADSRGYVFLLNQDRKQVEMYTPEGMFLTWIAGSADTFREPVDIGINGRDELYVLEKSGPVVFMYDTGGNLVNTDRNLATRPGVQLSKPVSMAVLNNGDFLLLDAASCITTHFDRLGDPRGTTGSKGVSNEGVFETARSICARPGKEWNIAVLDETASVVQVFSVQSPAPALRPDSRRLQIASAASSRPPSLALAVSRNGYRYAVPSSNPRTVVAYQDTSGKGVFTITGNFDEATALATDTAGNVYVVDGRGREVAVFDAKGVLARKFGRDHSVKLKYPSSIAIQHSGNIIVSDRSEGCLQMWNRQGVYQKIITSSENTPIRSPRRIQVDSKDQIYIWDDRENCIFRAGATGWPVASKQLRVRGEKPGSKEGEIGGFFVDPMDQIHVFNKTTSQLEIYSWDIEPVLRFTAGKPGTGLGAYHQVDDIFLDPEFLMIYFSRNRGAAQSVSQLLVKPSRPEGKLRFDVSDGMLMIGFERQEARSVIGYGLLTMDSEGGDSIVSKTSNSFVLIDPQRKSTPSLLHYNLVALSRSDYSEPGDGFDDYLSYACQLLNHQRYEEALSAFQRSLEVMGKSPRLTQFISARQTDVALRLKNDGNEAVAFQFIRSAFSLSPEKKEVLGAGQHVLYGYFLLLSGQNDYDEIIQNAERLIGTESLRPVVFGALDSLNGYLRAQSDENVLRNALRVSRKLVEWNPGDPSLAASLAATEFALFNLRRVSGASALELQALLAEAEKYSLAAVNVLRKSKSPYNRELLLHVQVLNAQWKFAEAERLITTELSSGILPESDPVVIDYRRELAAAYFGQGKMDLSAEESARVSKLNPGVQHDLELYAEALAGAGRWDDARRVYQELLLQYPQNAAYIGRIGSIELARGNFAEASFQFERSLQLNPADRSLYGPLAEAYDRGQNYKKALENYLVAIQYDKTRLANAKNRGASSREIDEIQQGLFEKLDRTGKMYEETGDYEEAIRYYSELTELNPASEEAHYKAGTACLGAGLVYDAVDYFYTACRIAPTNAQFTSAHANAVRMRESASKNSTGISVQKVHLNEVYPSLYHNYADPSVLPLGELIIANNTASPITPGSVTVFVKELMDRPTELKVPVVVGYSNARIRLAAIFNSRIMDRISDEKMQAEIEIRYTDNGRPVTVKKMETFVVHGRNAINWKDKRTLASFISPTEEVLIDYIKRIDALYRDVTSYDLNSSMVRALQIYTLLNRSNYVYSPDPVQSFASVSTATDKLDFIQYPTETMKRKAGDCDDLVALFTALLENGGVPAAYIDVPGHVMLAFDTGISPEALQASGIDRRDVIVFQNRCWIPVESTLIGSREFLDAWQSAMERYNRELLAGNFPELVPLSEARKVYTPASYVAVGFSDQLPESKSVLLEYNRQLALLMARTKKEVMNELESRYILESGNLFVKNRYATLLAQTGEIARAEEVLKEAIEMSPENPVLLNNMGNVYYLRKEARKAMEYYERAVKADPGDGEILINLCKASLLEGKKTEAENYFNQAVAIDRQLGTLYNELKSQWQ